MYKYIISEISFNAFFIGTRIPRIYISSEDGLSILNIGTHGRSVISAIAEKNMYSV